LHAVAVREAVCRLSASSPAIPFKSALRRVHGKGSDITHANGSPEKEQRQRKGSKRWHEAGNDPEKRGEQQGQVECGSAA